MRRQLQNQYIKGVMLLRQDDKHFLKHSGFSAYMASINKGERTPDPRNIITSAIEENVRAEIGKSVLESDYRILRWQARAITGHYRVFYRELDGVYIRGGRITVLMEVKASATRASMAGGLKQLRDAMTILCRTKPDVVGLLVICDLGEIIEGFGKSPYHPVTNFFASKDVKILEWPPDLNHLMPSNIGVSLLPINLASDWVADISPTVNDASAS